MITLVGFRKYCLFSADSLVVVDLGTLSLHLVGESKHR